MATKRSRVRLLVLALFAIFGVAAVVLIARPGPPSIPVNQTPRFAGSAEAVRQTIATGWSGPVASGSGTRCREAREAEVVWRTCEAAAGQLMTVSATTAVFDSVAAEQLMTVLHSAEDPRHAGWLNELASSDEVEFCTAAGPFWRATVDGRVVVGTVGTCPLS